MKKKIIEISIIITILFVGGSVFSFNKNNIFFQSNQDDTKTELAIYIGEEETNQIPLKDSGYYYNAEKSNCSDNASLKWDESSWSPIIKNVTETRTKCNLYFTPEYQESILNGTEPEIKGELVPVTIEGNGTVRKADLTKKWYSYEERQWANAVITQNSYDVLNREGKVKGATKEEGYVTFDGVDDYIDLGLKNYDFQKAITFSVNGKLNNNTSFQYLIANVEAGGFSIEAVNGEVYAAIYINGDYRRTSRVLLNKNEYYTITVTYDGSMIKLYINGEFKISLEYKGTIGVSNSPVVLAGNPDIVNGNLNVGNCSEVSIKQAAIYNRALSEEEIKANMSNEIKITDNTGLLSYVDFTNRNYEANEIIPESNIESYFVWIPRYKYQIFNEGKYTALTSIESKEQAIQVVFENKDTPISNGSTVGSWLTHPAFTSFNSNGMWVGKFETGKKSGEDNVRNGEAVQIKPNVSSWRNIQVANAFYTTYDYKRELDSHMMKNTEWGAVAYLQHSSYGSQSSIRINNNSSYITGYAANNEPTCGLTRTNEECNRYCSDGSCNKAYNTSTGYLASTTGNISGIYDMSGGSNEYVMGVMLDSSGQPMSGRNDKEHSEFKGSYGEGGSNTTGYDFPNTKYYDAYNNSNNYYAFVYRILGDATGEMGPFANKNYKNEDRQTSSWYSDEAWSLRSADPWYIRGGIYSSGSGAGIFSSISTLGKLSDGVSFRVVLTP